MLPSTIKAIKGFAAEHNLKDYEVFQTAISEFLEWRKDADLVIWLTLFAVRSDREVSEVVTQALREYRDKYKDEVEKK